MNLLFRLLYAAHASGTHHKIALRALEKMEADEAEGWRRLMLSRWALLLEGSKEPDKSFKDFQNHVLHPADSSGRAEWGGAVDAAERWYARMVDMLELRRWDDAVFSAGVLSHYISDPIMPLHTGSSDAETHIHRAAEWSVSRDFEALWREAAAASQSDGRIERLGAAERPDWLARLLRAASGAAHADYDALIASYDHAKGARRPEEGYDAAGRAIIARRLASAVDAVAFVFDQAVGEAGMTPPKTDLTVRSAVAALGVPLAWVRKKLDDAGDRAAVARIWDEVNRTGKLERNMPAECRVVRAKRAEAARRPAQRAPTSEPKTARSGRRRLERGSPVEDAPSIGPKTAARLAKLGVKTVGDLLSSDPKSVADGLKDSRMPARAVSVWRDQAALLVRLPQLRRAEAVLLVACGYRDVAAIAAADAVRLRDQLLSAARRPEMKRVLRSSIAPDLAAIRRAIAAARDAQTGL